MTACDTQPKTVSTTVNGAVTVPDLLAVRHWISGATELAKDESVPVGSHDLAGLRVTLQFPQKVATVVRDEGTDGDGHNSWPAPLLEPSLAAVLLFLKRTRRKGSNTRAQAIWEQCFIDTATTDGEIELPPEAAAALEKVRKKLPVPPRERKRTSATRHGCKGVIITVEPPGAAP